MPASKLPVKGNTAEEVIARQNFFLRAFAEHGTIRKTAMVTDIGRRTVTRWISEDKLGFREKFEEAKAEFADTLEDMAFERAKNQDENANPVLLITLLNAHKPEKYRPQSSPSDDYAKVKLMEMRNSFRTIIGTAEQIDEEVPEESPKELAHNMLRGKRSDDSNDS